MGSLRVISIKILLVISMLCKTNWWWELSTWSYKIQWVDTSTTSHYYFDRKPIGTANENLNSDIRARRVHVGKAIFNVEILANSKFTSIGNSTCYWQKIIKTLKKQTNKEKKFIPLTEGIFFLKILVCSLKKVQNQGSRLFLLGFFRIMYMLYFYRSIVFI